MAILSWSLVGACQGKKGPTELEQCHSAIDQLSDVPGNFDVGAWDNADSACAKLEESTSRHASKGAELLKVIVQNREMVEYALELEKKVESERRETEEYAAHAGERAAKQAELLTAIRTVEVKWLSFDRDSNCAGSGLPPYGKVYSGGTFAQNQQVAEADGCSHIRHLPKTWFCCPNERKTKEMR